MKTKFKWLWLLATSAFCILPSAFGQGVYPTYIQVGTNSGSGTGELIGRGTWQELNNNAKLFAAAISNANVAFTSYTNNAAIPANLIKSSVTAIEFGTNVFNFTAGSNYLGSFTNIYSFTDNGLNQGTNQLLTNSMSVGGGAWQPFVPTNIFAAVLFTNYSTNLYVTNSLIYSSVPGVTNTVGTNMAWLSFLATNQVITSAIGTNYAPVPIRISVLAGIPATGTVSVVTLSDNTLSAKYNGFAGQIVDFANATVLNLPLSSNGRNATNLWGTNIVAGTLPTNAFAASTMTWLNSLNIRGAQMYFDSGLITSDGTGDPSCTSPDGKFFTYSDAYGNYFVDFHDTSTGDAIEDFQGGLPSHEFLFDGCGSGGHLPDGFFIYDQTANNPALSVNGDDSDHVYINTFSDDGSGANFQVAGNISTDDHNIYSDGSGNLTAQTFTPVSDRALKEQIQPLLPADALRMACALTNYSWRFKAGTNYSALTSRHAIATNTIPYFTNASGQIFYRPQASFVITTNQVGHPHAASGTQFGPMAQDWHTVTGLDDGHGISDTAFKGLLLGSIQALSQQNNLVSDSSGHGGTCLHLSASDNGQDIYLHVTSGGTISVTASP